MLQEINNAPRILTNFISIMPPQFLSDLDSYLKTRAPVTFLTELRTNLQVHFNVCYFCILFKRYLNFIIGFLTVSDKCSNKSIISFENIKDILISFASVLVWLWFYYISAMGERVSSVFFFT